MLTLLPMSLTTNTYAATDTLSTGGALTTADKFTVGPGYVSFVKPTFFGAQPGLWTVTGNNGNDTFTISGAAGASLIGGSGTNTYVVSAGASLNGTINGGSGAHNALTYSKYGTGVIVDLLTEQATGIDGFALNGISHIENVTGSMKGGDILVGDANPNVLITLAGNNIVIGGAKGGDTQTSTSAKSRDILNARTTSYDTNIAALQTILATWKTATRRTMPQSSQRSTAVPSPTRSAMATRQNRRRRPFSIPAPAMWLTRKT
jgi:hypothetical protein